MVENKLTWTYHKLSFRTSPKKCGNLAYGEGGSEFFACNLYIFQYDREGRVRKGHPQVWGRKRIESPASRS